MNKTNRIQNSAVWAIILVLLITVSCKETKKTEGDNTETQEAMMEESEPFFDLSLAQWSIHRMIREEGVDPYTFAEKAKKWGFSGLEYVNQLYNKELENANYSKEAMAAFVEKNNTEAKKYGLKNVLIMVDNEGGMAVSETAERNKTVENHYKWVDAAAAMGCHAIRVNLYGSEDPAEWKANAVDALTKLSTYAKDKNINILVENHGGLSSNGAMVADVMKTVNMANCGTLPDFGNFCIKRGDAGCADMYDIYKGVKELMPYAKAVSAKSNDFDENGNEKEIDYVKMLQMIKDAGYEGYIGVEYEGNELGEEEGIMATKKLMLEAASKLN